MANYRQQNFMRARQGMNQGCQPIPAVPYTQPMAEIRPAVKRKNMYEGVDCLPLAMAYVPWQKFCDTFELNKALCVGTVFPELEKPFCGRRGAR